jgi:hypothetical protein
VKPIKQSFQPEIRVVPIASIRPMANVLPSMRSSKKYQRIRSSIHEIGIVEPIVVFPKPEPDAPEQYLLLDGHLRLDVLQQMGKTEVQCLISTDDEALTYNHKVNHISPIQEHFMILKALESGVPEDRIAASLNIDVKEIRKKRDLLDGICPEAVELLRDRRISPDALRTLRGVKPMRQIAMAELMNASNNWSVTFSKCLFAATPQEELVKPDGHKDLPGMRPEDLARMEREMRVLEKDFRRIEDSHGRNTLNLVLALGYVRKLLENAEVVKFLSRKHIDMLGEFQKLLQENDLSAADDAAQPSAT